VPGNTLASLVLPSGQTTLHSMKQLVQSLGLYCKVVQTDLAGLQNLGSVKAILHIPTRNHFVVLDSADDRNVQIVDLSDNKFCYSDNADSFRRQWSQGLAMLVSSTPIAGAYPNVDDASLNVAVGGSGYSCTVLLQSTCYFLCQLPCNGVFIYYWERWGCEPAPSGTCTSRPLVRTQESDCVPGVIVNCTWGDWYTTYILACL
jgi:hypothetical protein